MSSKDTPSHTLRGTFHGGKKIGHYMESTGGGTPIPKGEKLADHPEAHRVSQPRDEEGRFGHNSLNLKTLKYKSRGKTVPAFLRGTVVTYARDTGNISLVDEEGKRYRLPDGIETAEQLVKICSVALEDGTLSGFDIDERIKGKGGTQVRRGFMAGIYAAHDWCVTHGAEQTYSWYKTLKKTPNWARRIG